MEQEDGLKNTEEQPVVKVVEHDPNKFKSKSPKVLGEIIAQTSDESGLDREVVYILFQSGWEYSALTNTWSRSSPPEQNDGN